MNRNSNVYTVIYAVVLCGLVAVLLSAAALGLKDKQKANTDNEKKQQILMAVAGPLGQEVTFDNAAELWDKLNEIIVDGDAFETVAKAQFKSGVVKENAQLPVYVATINEKPYYIMCMYGAGLWDAIWGYIAVEADGSTIAGASFDHAGETAGLGAKIKDDPKFAEAFVGMQVFQNGAFAPVVVSKKNVDNKVDAITGATKTSDCVSFMVEESLKGYQAFLQSLTLTEGCCENAEGCCGHCQEGMECCKADSCAMDSCQAACEECPNKAE